MLYLFVNRILITLNISGAYRLASRNNYVLTSGYLDKAQE